MTAVRTLPHELKTKVDAAHSPTTNQLPPGRGPVILISHDPAPTLWNSIMEQTDLTGDECVIVRDELELFDYLATIDDVDEAPLAVIAVGAALSTWSTTLLKTHPVLSEVPRLCCAGHEATTFSVTSEQHAIALLRTRRNADHRTHGWLLLDTPARRQEGSLRGDELASHPSAILERLANDLRADAEDAILSNATGG